MSPICSLSTNSASDSAGDGEKPLSSHIDVKEGLADQIEQGDPLSRLLTWRSEFPNSQSGNACKVDPPIQTTVINSESVKK